MFYPLILYKITLLLLLSSFCLSYLLTPIAQNLAFRFNVLDTPNYRKIHKSPTPLLGGLAIFLAFLFTLVFFYLLISYQLFITGPAFFSFGEEKLFWLKMALYLICSLFIILIGILDDFKSLDFKLKLLIQSLVAFIMVFSGSRLNFFHLSYLNALISFFWIVGLTNSFNLLDNMNGLSSGLAIIILSLFAFLAYTTHHALFALFLLIPIGSLLGFLPYNFPKARIFLGDTGSLFIGFSLATYSTWLFDHLIKSNTSHWAVLIEMLFLLFIPLCDTLTVIAIRIKKHHPIYVGDTNHLSHQLVKRGLAPTKAVLILFMGSLLTGILGLLIF